MYDSVRLDLSVRLDVVGRARRRDCLMCCMCCYLLCWSLLLSTVLDLLLSVVLDFV